MEPFATIQILLEIDGVRYGGRYERLRPQELTEVYAMGDDIRSLIVPALATHFGLALAAEK